MDRYWLNVGDGKSYGPYTVEELRAFAVEGRVHVGCMVCAQRAVGASGVAEQWVPAATVVPDLGSVAPPPLPAVGASFRSMPSGEVRRVPLVWSILVSVASLFFCCLPVGLGALFAATTANAKYEAGDFEGGQRRERSYRIWMWVSIVLILIGALVTYWTIDTAMDLMKGLDLGG